MLILLTIFLLIFTPLAMLILHLVRPKFSIQGFLVVLAALAGWIMVLLARSGSTQVISLLPWDTASSLLDSPSLIIDQTSWYFSLALMSLSFSVIITSIAQLGQSFKPDQTQNLEQIKINETQQLTDEEKSTPETAGKSNVDATSNWQIWAGILIITSLGIVAVTAGNMLTLLLAWAALDVIELLILMSQVLDHKLRERIVLAFTARMAGIGAVLLAATIPWSQGLSLSFNNISPATSIYLIIAAGLRLGIIPLHLPYKQVFPLRRGLGTILRLVPAAASYILLVRVANLGVLGASTPYLLILTALVGLYAAINWMTARDEITGRPYWLLGTASLAIASAIMNQPVACLAWSIASVLSGGLIFSMFLRHKNLIPIALLGIINLSALPFTPTWRGTTIYTYAGTLSNTIPPQFFYLQSIAFILINAFLLAGFIRHTFRVFFPSEAPTKGHIERWVWFVYPFGLVFILLTHFLIGFWSYPGINDVALPGWIMGLVVVIISGIIWYISWHPPLNIAHKAPSGKPSPTLHLLSLEWLYRYFWRIFRLLTRLSSLFSTILEGDGGILWALVLFALIFVFLQR